MKQIFLYGLVFLLSLQAFSSSVKEKGPLFASLQETRALLVDQSKEKYIDSCSSSCLRAMTSDFHLSEDTLQARIQAREKFPNYAREFTEKEKQILALAVVRLEKRCALKWPLIKKFPWKFAKVADHFCAGFPHTRNQHIVFSSSVLQQMNAYPLFAEILLLHEKMHVLQRAYPRRFDKLYKEVYGFIPLKKLQISREVNDKILYNPDAMKEWWAVRHQSTGQLYLPVLTLSELKKPNMSKDIQLKAFPLRKDEKKGVYHTETASLAYPQSFPPIQKKFFWLRRFGWEHPNEVSAYGSELIYLHEFFGKEEVSNEIPWGPLLQKSSLHFSEILSD